MDNYKQIKQDLDQLRSIVEKSELWVYKGQGPDEAMDGASGENEHKKTEVGEMRLTLSLQMDGLLNNGVPSSGFRKKRRLWVERYSQEISLLSSHSNSHSPRK